MRWYVAHSFSFISGNVLEISKSAVCVCIHIYMVAFEHIVREHACIFGRHLRGPFGLTPSYMYFGRLACIVFTFWRKSRSVERFCFSLFSFRSHDVYFDVKLWFCSCATYLSRGHPYVIYTFPSTH